MAKVLGTGTLVVDDNDVPWFYDVGEGVLKCLYDNTPDGGYRCNLWEDAKAVLVDGGYVEDEADLNVFIMTNEPDWCIPDPPEAPNPYKVYFRQLALVNSLQHETQNRVAGVGERYTLDQAQEAVNSLAYQRTLLGKLKDELVERYLKEEAQE